MATNAEDVGAGPAADVTALAEPLTGRLWRELQTVDVAVRREVVEQLTELRALEWEVEQGLLAPEVLREPFEFGPTEEERRILDADLAEYGENSELARPWSEVYEELRSR